MLDVVHTPLYHDDISDAESSLRDNILRTPLPLFVDSNDHESPSSHDLPSSYGDPFNLMPNESDTADMMLVDNHHDVDAQPSCLSPRRPCRAMPDPAAPGPSSHVVTVRKPRTDAPWLTGNTIDTPDGVGVPRNPGANDTSSGAFNLAALSEALSTIEVAMKGNFYGPKVRKDVMHPQTGELLSRCTGQISGRALTLDQNTVSWMRRSAAQSYYANLLAVSTDMRITAAPVNQSPSRLSATTPSTSHDVNDGHRPSLAVLPANARPLPTHSHAHSQKPPPQSQSQSQPPHPHQPGVLVVNPGVSGATPYALATPLGAEASAAAETAQLPIIMFQRVPSASAPLAPRPAAAPAPRLNGNIGPRPTANAAAHAAAATAAGASSMGTAAAKGTGKGSAATGISPLTSNATGAVPIQPSAPVKDKEELQESKLEAKRIKNRLSAAKSNQKRREQLEAQKKELALLRQRVTELKSRKQRISAENDSLRTLQEKMGAESRPPVRG